MKKTIKYTIISIVGFVFIVVPIVYILLMLMVCHGIYNVKILEIPSPSNEFVAVLFTAGFQDRETKLYMTKSTDENKELMLVGYTGILLAEAAWSKDGSLFITRRVGEGSDFSYYCYDTKNNISIVPDRKQQKEQYDYGSKYYQKTTKLIKERGAPEVFISYNDIQRKSRKIGYWEDLIFSETFKKADREARKKIYIRNEGI